MANIDQSLFQLINATWTNAWFDVFFPAITDLHKTFFFKLAVIPFIGLVFFLKFRAAGALIFLSCCLCVATSDFSGNLIKKTVQRLRPGDIAELQAQVRSPYDGTSFISNHASNSFALATFIGLFFPSSLIPLYFLAFLVAYSRVYNGVHFPFDVTVGALLGLIWGIAFVKMTVRLMRKKWPLMKGLPS